jgi:RimJ/RimL family protein N-acetyltransferase
MLIPALTTARLRQRVFRESDLDAYAAMCADEDITLNPAVARP